LSSAKTREENIYIYIYIPLGGIRKKERIYIYIPLGGIRKKERIGKKKTKEKEDNTIRHVTLVFGEDKGEKKKGQLMLHLMVKKEKNIYIYIYVTHLLSEKKVEAARGDSDKGT
jgi:hypothetical protein